MPPCRPCGFSGECSWCTCFRVAARRLCGLSVDPGAPWTHSLGSLISSEGPGRYAVLSPGPAFLRASRKGLDLGRKVEDIPDWHWFCFLLRWKIYGSITLGR